MRIGCRLPRRAAPGQRVESASEGNGGRGGPCDDDCGQRPPIRMCKSPGGAVELGDGRASKRRAGPVPATRRSVSPLRARIRSTAAARANTRAPRRAEARPRPGSGLPLARVGARARRSARSRSEPRAERAVCEQGAYGCRPRLEIGRGAERRGNERRIAAANSPRYAGIPASCAYARDWARAPWRPRARRRGRPGRVATETLKSCGGSHCPLEHVPVQLSHDLATADGRSGEPQLGTRPDQCPHSGVHFAWWSRAHSSRTVPRVIPRSAWRVAGWMSAR